MSLGRLVSRYSTGMGAVQAQGAQGVREARRWQLGAAGARADARVRPGRWARGLGARPGYGLCTRCTWPVFDPV